MTLHICVLGIDGSGKSMLAASLPAVLAAELDLVAGSAGETFHIVGPDEDYLAPQFHPDGFPISAWLSQRFKCLAKRFVDSRYLYPAFKLAQMISQDAAARVLARRYGVEVMGSDGNVLLSATGRAGNYRRPASDPGGASAPAPGVEDLEAVLANIFDGRPLPPESKAKLPPLGVARFFYRLCRLLRFPALWLPDTVIFLDLSPKNALARIAGRRAKLDRHENEADLGQAREMYLKTLEALERYRSGGSPLRIACIAADHLSPGEVLRAALEVVKPQAMARRPQGTENRRPLGTPARQLAGSAAWRKVFRYRYVFRYLLPEWFSGAWREPAFLFSRLGRFFLREGYSAGVMRAIYEQDEKPYGVVDRIFLGYPLHRAVYDRLHILTRRIESELETRLKSGREVRVFTAPSGFADDLFRPLESIHSRAPGLAERVQIVAADLDPQGQIAAELPRRAANLGVRLRFLRGDMAAGEMRDRLGEAAPYDLALFVGLSSWLPRIQAVPHLRRLRAHLRQDGLLVTDCFTAQPYALSGRHAGYKAQYYTAESYCALLDYCGFDGLTAQIESGRDAINHVVVASPR